jgi:crotonobetaine/carnitine-CoA ligase
MVQYLGIVMPALFALPASPEERQHSVRIAVGAGVDPTMHGRFEERFGFPIVEVWGMTEVAIASIASREPRAVGSRSIGHPCVGMEFRVVDDRDQPRPKGEIGELVVRRKGPDPRMGLVSEYLKDKAATDLAWRGDWFHTGDLACENEDGSYRFVDRMKDIIRRSGQNIAASEIEAALAEHPDVERAACIAAPDEMREEEVFACIVLKQGVSPSQHIAEDIAVRARQRLAYFKVPGWIAFFDTLPLTATQKLQKRSIFKPGADPRLHPGAHDLRMLKRPGQKAG